MKVQIDIQFVKDVAKDFGIDITDEQAKKVHKIVSSRTSKEDYYYGLKEYFGN